MAVTIENRTYVSIAGCDWHVSKTISIQGLVFAELNMQRNDVIRYTAYVRYVVC